MWLMQSPWQKKPQQHPKIKYIVTIAGNSLMWNDDKTLQVIVENSFALMMDVIYEKEKLHPGLAAHKLHQN